MSRLALKKHQAERRKQRVSKMVNGTTERPRLTVRVTNLHIIAQVINDETHKTIAHSTSMGQKDAKGSLTDKAVWVGKDIAKKANAAKVTKVAFDRGSKLYHGRVKALAEAAREEGLEF